MTLLMITSNLVLNQKDDEMTVRPNSAAYFYFFSFVNYKADYTCAANGF